MKLARAILSIGIPYLFPRMSTIYEHSELYSVCEQNYKKIESFRKGDLLKSLKIFVTLQAQRQPRVS